MRDTCEEAEYLLRGVVGLLERVATALTPDGACEACAAMLDDAIEGEEDLAVCFSCHVLGLVNKETEKIREWRKREISDVPPKKERQFEGANWVEKSMKVKNMSRLGRKVADILGVVYAGIYHIDQKTLNKVDWGHSGWVEIKLRDSLSTWDFNRLTALVIACHDAAVRVEIDGNSWHMLMLRFHERQRDGRIPERHPTMEEALASWRKQIAGTLMYEHGEQRGES